MPQDLNELRNVLSHFKQFSGRGKWQPIGDVPLKFHVTSFGTPDDISVDAVAALVGHASEHLGVQLELRGGGFGCFDMGFASESGNGADLEHAVDNDPHFQKLLNEVNANIVRIETADASRCYSAFRELKIALATNRNQQEPKIDEYGVTGLFGENVAKNMSYGVADVLVQDKVSFVTNENSLKRVWKKLDLVLFLISALAKLR